VHSKYRFYPTPEQSELLAQTFRCVRFVYNSILRWRTDAYYERQEKIGDLQANAHLGNFCQNNTHYIRNRWPHISENRSRFIFNYTINFSSYQCIFCHNLPIVFNTDRLIFLEFSTLDITCSSETPLDLEDDELSHSGGK